MAKDQATGPAGGASWKSPASAIGGGAVGAAGAFGITQATSEQIAWGVAVWSLTTLAGVIAFLGKSWVERRFVHVQELVDSNSREQSAWAIVSRSIGAGKQAVVVAEEATRMTSKVASTVAPTQEELKDALSAVLLDVLGGQSRDKAGG